MFAACVYSAQAVLVWSVAEASKAATRQADKAAAQQGDRTSNTSKDVNLLLFTWNVGHKAPSTAELAQWLPAGGEGLDVLIVASQENAYVAKQKVPTDAATADGTQRE